MTKSNNYSRQKAKFDEGTLAPLHSQGKLAEASKLLELPAMVRGFGHFKLCSIVSSKAQQDALKLDLDIREFAFC